jgi:hypothetical protein
MEKKIDWLTWYMHQLMEDQQEQRWLKAAYYRIHGNWPNLASPQTFTEKMCWMMMNYQHEDLSRIVDKVAFKDYIKEKLGAGYTAALYDVMEDEWAFSLDKLPTTCVLKSNISSKARNLLLVKDKNALDEDAVRFQLSEMLQPWNTSQKTFSRWYRKIQPKILVEEYLLTDSGDLNDYKFFCSQGTAWMLLFCNERFIEQRKAYYDMDWNVLPIGPGSQQASPVPRPAQFEEMKAIAEKLSQPFPFVRIDFYIYRDKVYVGEFTFASGGGLVPDFPDDWNKKLGEMVQLPIH